MSVTVKPPPAQGEQDFPSLALANTRLLPGGTPADLLEDEMAAGRWLGTPVTAAEAARLRELREAIRALFEAYETAAEPPRDALAAVNEAVAAGPLVTQLSWDDTGPRRTSYRTANGSRAALAADAIMLLTSPAAARLHACAAHGCIRWYLRSHGARQWCSTRCGDRVRAARHYARHHRGDSV